MPIARNPDGAPVTGPVWARFVNVAGNVNTQSLPGAAGRTPASLDTAVAKLISATCNRVWPAQKDRRTGSICPTSGRRFGSYWRNRPEKVVMERKTANSMNCTWWI